MDNTPLLSLPLLANKQALQTTFYDEAIKALDTLVMLSVLDRDLSAPPASPDVGDRYIVKAPGSGDAAWLDDHVVVYRDGHWFAYEPRLGWTCYVQDEGVLIAWDGTAWQPALEVLGGAAVQNLSLLGIGTTADATNPVSAKLNNTLWTAKTVAEGGDGNLRTKLSKESAAKTLSLLFQDNFSGRAEIGLTGDDDFHFKVSADGSSWTEALTIDRATGGVHFLAHEVSVASAATCDIGSAAGLKVSISGTTTITSLGTQPHRLKLVRFSGALTLTHHATSLILPGGTNIVTAAGDTATFTSDASGNWRCLGYTRASGAGVNKPAFSANKNNTNQTGMSSSTYTKITFTTELYDQGGYYDAANSKWTPPAGMVVIAAGMVTEGNTAGSLIVLGIYKNGSLYKLVSTFAGSSSGDVGISLVDRCNGTDSYEMYGYLVHAGSGAFQGVNENTWFTGGML